VYRAIPWRINHPSNEPDSVTLLMSEYGVEVKLETGAKVVLVNKQGKVSEITSYNFTVPSEGFAIIYNSNITYLVDERYKVGDEVRYEVIIKPVFTKAEDWNKVVNAMCLDGGGSIALYYPTSRVNIGGRNINNCLAFIENKIVGEIATPTKYKVTIDEKEISLTAYNINGNNYFKLGDIGEEFGFEVN